MFVTDEESKAKSLADKEKAAKRNYLKNLAIYGVVFLAIILAIALYFMCKLCPGTIVVKVRGLLATLKS